MVLVTALLVILTVVRLGTIGTPGAVLPGI
jgi:hypothetical protein